MTGSLNRAIAKQQAQPNIQKQERGFRVKNAPSKIAKIRDAQTKTPEHKLYKNANAEFADSCRALQLRSQEVQASSQS